MIMWENLTPVDWVFVIIPPIFFIYFAYHLWQDNRVRKARTAVQEEELEAALVDWVEHPETHKIIRINEIISDMSNKSVTKVLEGMEEPDGLKL